MKAALRESPQKVKCIDMPSPSPKAGEVLVRVNKVGICGSDIVRYGEDVDRWNSVVLGHEFAGEVQEVASDVSTVKVGDRVTAAPLVPCHKCEFCLKGKFSLCGGYTFIGSRIQGAFAEYVCVPAINIVPLPDNLDYAKAALVEPITVCLHPILPLGNLLGKSAVVTGAGTIGVLAAQVFKAMGAKTVIVSDVIDEKLDLAKKHGADITVNVIKDNLEDIVKENCSGGGADVVFESSGSNPAKMSAIKVCKGGGTILLVGTSPVDITFGAELFELITRKEINMVGSWMNYSAPYPGEEWSTAVWMLEKGLIKTEGIISHEFGIEGMQDALDVIFGKKENFTKIIITP
ncbi:MAG: galactitol-1-phosphate 5-dehydrogenase [Planctomycetes bacterium]|nr:galactitol-1-phosphate 5-dehydrogenase [Planctomycetota bacterium]